MLELKGGQVTLGANWENGKNIMSLCILYTLMLYLPVSLTHALNICLLWNLKIRALWRKLTLNSIFRILWLNPLLVQGSSIALLIFWYFNGHCLVIVVLFLFCVVLFCFVFVFLFVCFVRLYALLQQRESK